MKNEIINETWDVQRVKELTMNKVQASANEIDTIEPRYYRGKFAVMVATVVLITLTSAITVLAVSGTVNFGSLFRSVFENEQAEPYIIAEESIIASVSESDIEVRVISAFYDDFRGLFINLEIHDPMRVLLSQLSEEDSIAFFRQFEPTEFANMYIRAASSREEGTGIVFIDDYTIRAGFDHVGYEITDSGDIAVHFHIVASGVCDNAGAHTDDRPFLSHTGFTLRRNVDMEQPAITPILPFLEIMEVTLDGSILTIAYRDIEASAYGWNNGTLILARHDDDSPIWAFDGYSADDESRSVILFDVGTANLEELRLDWTNLSVDNLIFGNWEFIIPSEYLMESRTFLGEIDGYDVEIDISALGAWVHIDGFVNMRKEGYEDYEISPSDDGWPNYFYLENTLILHLADGTTIEPRLSWSRQGLYNLPDYLPSYMYEMEFVHPNDIVRVTLLGVEIGG